MLDLSFSKLDGESVLKSASTYRVHSFDIHIILNLEHANIAAVKFRRNISKGGLSYSFLAT